MLGALRRFLDILGADYNAAGADDDIEHEIETMDQIDSAARKLGGDPTTCLYGAAEY